MIPCSCFVVPQESLYGSRSPSATKQWLTFQCRVAVQLTFFYELVRDEFGCATAVLSSPSGSESAQ